jgi:hypothetical protein
LIQSCRLGCTRVIALMFLCQVLPTSAWGAETLWGLTATNTLVRFSSETPGTLLRTLPIIGLTGGEQLIAIEVEKAGRLTGLSNAGRRYEIDRRTGAATLLNPAAQVVTPSGAAFGATEHGQVLRVVSDTGSWWTIDNATGRVESWLVPAIPGRFVGLAWQPELPQHVALDAMTDSLYHLSWPSFTIVPIGPLGVDTSDEAGLEFGPHDGLLYAALTVGGTPRLYTVSPQSGQATLVGPIASSPIISLTADLQGGVIVTRVSPAPVGGTDIPEIDVTLTYTVRRTGDDTVAAEYWAFMLHSTSLNNWPPGQDFVDVDQRLLYAPGELEKTITVTLLADTIPERDVETFRLYVTEIRPGQNLPNLPSNYLAFGFAEINVRDDDNRTPVLTVVSPFGASTSTPSPTVTVSGVVADEDPGTVQLRLFGPGGLPYLPIATGGGSPFTFAGVALQPGANHFSLEVSDVHARYGTTRNFTVTREQGSDHTYVLAEGATGSFFSTDLLIANPHAAAVPVTIDFLRGDGTVVPHTLTVPAQQRTTVAVDTIPGLEAASMAAVVTAHDYPVVVERTMRWDQSGYGASTERAAGALSRTWYFAEGSQGFFSTFLLLVNPQPSTNGVTVRFLREYGGPFTRTYTMAPRQRLTIDAGALPELVGQSFGIEVTFTDPGMAERSMYFGHGALWEAGHESAGAPVPATDWHLAEGATGSFFETFILVANPSNTAADITMTYLPEAGAPVTRSHQVPANGRLTVNIEMEDARLANLAAIGTPVSSTVPVVVERSQYWPWSPAQWYEAHNTFGQTETATHWGLAEGRTGGPAGYMTYVMVTNGNTGPADVSMKFLREGGAPVVKTFTVAPTSRLTVFVGGAQVPEITEGGFGVEIVSSLPISVERAVYSNANGQFWAAGTLAAATRLP